MNSIFAALQLAAAELQRAGIPSAALDARLLMQQALACDHAMIIRDRLRVLSAEEVSRFEALLARRLAREPMSHITGQREFWKDTFNVCADVLDPRPDSETLIEVLLEIRPQRDAPYHLLDLGTGAGCLLLSALREYGQAKGVGVDVSEASARVAQRNAMRLGLQARATFIVSDWTDALQSQFDVVISNPPYIAEDEIAGLEPEVRNYEPHRALSGGEDGLDAYRVLMPRIAGSLKADGVALIELGAHQCKAVSQLAAGAGLQVRLACADLAGIERALVLMK